MHVETMEKDSADIHDRIAPVGANPVHWRHPLRLLAGLALLFVVQASIAPFDLTFEHPGRRWLAESSALSNFPDAIANVFLYVPLGFLVNWLLVGRLRHRIGSWIASIFLCGALSFALESIQALSPSRVSSLIDVTNNVIGAALGAGLAVMTREIAPRLISAVIEECRESVAVVRVKSYVLLLVIIATLPFSFALDRGNLGEAAKRAILTPFGQSYQTAHEIKYPTNNQTGRSEDWTMMKRRSRWAAECASFTLLAWLIQQALQNRLGFGRIGCTALTLWLGALLAIFFSALQFTVVSRGFDATDIFFRVCGLVIGTIFWRRIRRQSHSTTGAYQSHAKFACIGALAFILYNGTIPWQFSVEPREAFSRLSAANFIPFLPYFETRADRMFGDVAEKLAMYAVLGVLIQLRAMWENPRGREGVVSRVLSSPLRNCIAISLGIEFIQIFLPARFPGLTDPFLAAVGCVLGLMVSDHVQSLYFFARTMAVTSSPGDRMAATPQSPAEFLLSTIAEPHPGAPKEGVPAKSPEPTRQPSH